MENHGESVIRTCVKCGKLSDKFYKSNTSWCKPCVNEYNKAYRKPYDSSKHKAWRDNNKDKIKGYWKKHREKHRDYRLNYLSNYRYGMTREEYELFISNPCEVCGSTTDPRYVDHSHSTNVVRGCLCRSCNSALGQLKEDPLVIRNLEKYIRRHINVRERPIRE